MDMKQWWNDSDWGIRSVGRKTCRSVTLSTPNPICTFFRLLLRLSSFISHRPQELFMGTLCMQWGHSEADSRSTTQHVPQLLWNSGRSLQFSQKPDTDVYSNPHTSMPHSHIQFETCFNIMLLNPYSCIKLVPSIQISRVQCCYVFLDICRHDLITSIIFSADYRPCIFSLFSVVPVWQRPSLCVVTKLYNVIYSVYTQLY